jgi:hypothetical protein
MKPFKKGFSTKGPFNKRTFQQKVLSTKGPFNTRDFQHKGLKKDLKKPLTPKT